MPRISKRLRAKAREQATNLGHTLKNFEKVPLTADNYQSSCTKCGATVTVAPHANEQIVGNAVTKL